MSANVATGHFNGLEENIREAANLAQAMFMLLFGITAKGYPFAIDDAHLDAMVQLAIEIRDRTRAAVDQYAEEAAADRVAFTQQRT